MISKPKLILPQEQVVPTLVDAVYILKMLRQHTIKFDEHLGFENRRAKRIWEEKADKFLESLLIVNTNKSNHETDQPNTSSPKNKNDK